MVEVKPNFFTNAVLAPQMTQIMLTNSSDLRERFGMWCYERFDELVSEYNKHGRFLTLDEIENPLQ